MADSDSIVSLSPNTRFISLVVGDSVRLYRPHGYLGVEYTNSNTEIYRFGFKILYPTLGKFIADSGDAGTAAAPGARSWVTYLHEKSGKQVIEFMSSELGTHKFHIVIQGVLVHDHASIAMGGPAFATYYSETTVNTTTTQEGG